MKYNFLLILIITFGCSACQTQIANSQTVNESNKHSDSQNTKNLMPKQQTGKENEEIPIKKIVSVKPILNYQGYQLKKIITKKNDPDDISAPVADINNAVLQKDGKEIFKFEGSYYPTGNQLEFGLFSTLNNKNKQLIIFETSNRFGRVWIVNLLPKPKIIFDSQDWEGFREFAQFSDIDNDGIYDISLMTEKYASFDLAHLYTPFNSFYFKYDDKSQTYLPANHKFFETGELDERISNIKNLNINVTDTNNFKEFLGIFLDFIYAGKEKEAWEFYDKKCNLDDKIERKEKIKAFLQNDKFYQFIKNSL